MKHSYSTVQPVSRFKVTDRVRLTAEGCRTLCGSRWTAINAGRVGTVTKIEEPSIVHVAWDAGSNLPYHSDFLEPAGIIIYVSREATA